MMRDIKEELLRERTDLLIKLRNLEVFIEMSAIEPVDGVNYLPLYAQAAAMTTYVHILNLRIAEFDNEK